MSLFTNRQMEIVEKDYTEQLIFSDKMPMSLKNKLCCVVLGVLFLLFAVNMVFAMGNSLVFSTMF